LKFPAVGERSNENPSQRQKLKNEKDQKQKKSEIHKKSRQEISEGKQ
jgi:hypothetical protein